jgi:hypothetical protein
LGELIRNLYQQWGVICIELFRSNTPKSLCCKEFSQLVPLSACIPDAWPEEKTTIKLPPIEGKRLNILGIMKRDNQLFYHLFTSFKFN